MGAHHRALGGETGAVQGNRQPEVTNLRGAVVGEPDVSRLQVPVHDAPSVGELQPLAGLLGDLDSLFQGKPLVGGSLYQTFYITAAHQFGNHVGLVRLLTQVEDGDYVRVRTQATHSLGLTGDAGSRGFIQTLGLYQGEGHLLV